MSQIIEYVRNLFHLNSSHNRKRRRTDNAPVEIEPFPKYKRVTNHFPRKYNTFILDDEPDFFREVRQRANEYNELVGNHLMDQHRRQMKAVLDDGEFSDEDDLNSFRMPSMAATARHRNVGYDFKRFYESDQPSTSQAFSRTNYSQLLNGAKQNGSDDDVQYVGTTQKSTNPKSQSGMSMPPLIPISKTISPISNGYSRECSVKPQPTRGFHTVLNFLGKNRAFSGAQKKFNFDRKKSVIERKYNIDMKQEYDDLLQQLIPRYATGAVNNTIKQVQEPKQIATIDLSDDNDLQVSKPDKKKFSLKDFPSYKSAKADFTFKKPTAIVELSDDDVDQSQFERETYVASTPQIIKIRDNEQNHGTPRTAQNYSNDASVAPILTPVNSLKERHSLRSSLNEDALQKIVERFNQKRQEKDKSITEEALNASKLERDRIDHERLQQRRIDESITAALAEKCIILDEVEEVIDEFPPLSEKQDRFVNFALHGPKDHVIISKFNMNITRHDLGTLDGLNWLNDEVINFYMELIKERSEIAKHLPKVHVMNTFFLGKLLSSGYAGVRRWTRKVDIFSYDIIPIPVHVGGVHWCMSIIHLKNKSIKYYDSMGHPNYAVLEALSQYLKDESLDKKKVPFNMSDWTIECVRDCPQQKNGSDCGVFSCQFAEFICRNSSISFEQQHMTYFRRKMICEIGDGRLFLGY